MMGLEPTTFCMASVLGRWRGTVRAYEDHVLSPTPSPSLYPDLTVTSEPPAAMLVGGIISRVRAAVPGLQITLGMPELRRLLEADADFAASAIAPDQKQVLAARDPATSAEAAAIWTADRRRASGASARPPEGARALPGPSGDDRRVGEWRAPRAGFRHDQGDARARGEERFAPNLELLSIVSGGAVDVHQDAVLLRKN
jgi:hypothetical protein